MHGLINLDKPLGLTSAQALERVRTITGQRRSGHAGSLDPLASGVLILCLGRGTKLVEKLMDQPKIYRTIARLDLTSHGYDQEGTPVPVAVDQPPTEARVREVLAQFEGDILQVPPAFSAVKVGGRPAYKLSRRGKPPVLEPRPIRIYWLHLWRYEWPVIDFEVASGRGTYIRALIRDIGTALGTGGCLTTLTRDAVGPFTRATAWALDKVAAAIHPEAYVTPLAEAAEMLSAPVIPPRPR